MSTYIVGLTIKLTCTTEWDTSSYLAKKKTLPQIVKWPRIFAVGLSKRRFLQDRRVPATSDFISPTLHNLAAQLFFFSPHWRRNTAFSGTTPCWFCLSRNSRRSQMLWRGGRWGWYFSSPRQCRAFFSPLPTERDENLGPQRLLLDFKSSQTWMDVKGKEGRKTTGLRGQSAGWS